MIGALVLIRQGQGGGPSVEVRERVALEAKTSFSNHIVAFLFSVMPVHFFTPTCKL